MISNKLYVATHNKNKLKEMAEILPNMDVLADNPDGVEETASDFRGNALIKVRAIAARHVGEWCMADDSGLEVAALGGAPGVRSARYSEETPISDGTTRSKLNNEKLLRTMRGVADRTANFTCAIALVDPSGKEHTAVGRCFGHVAEHPAGAEGFGYDPLFVPDGSDRSFAELLPSEKNAISHRGRALAKVRQIVEGRYACCLTVAGSDSGGNAGIQADLRTFHCYGMHGCTVLTALTAQNPFGVSSVHDVPADFVAAQLDAVLGTYGISAMKTGMLDSEAIVEVVADKLSRHPEMAKVIDPVIVATSGARLASDAVVAALARKLFPLARIITPNLPEAKALCGGNELRGVELARRLNEKFGCAVLVKGGHNKGANAVDVLCDNGETTEFALPWVENPMSTHGTGCSFAAALASEFALGRDTKTAVAGAKRYVHEAIANSFSVGSSCGVLGFADFTDR